MRFSSVKYVRAGQGWENPVMYVVVMNRTEHGSWKVEVSPSDQCGSPVSDPIEWDIFPSWWDARKYRNRKYKEYDRFVNNGR